nr:MAG TPA: hypothetical protein [Caudoviricetes sp.]
MKYSTWKPSEIESLKKPHQDSYNRPMNYKQLCTALGITAKSGVSKENQLEDLQCVYDLEIDSSGSGWTKYILHGYRGIEYLPTPETLQAIEYILLRLFYDCNTTELRCTNNQLLEFLDLVNMNFDILRSKTYSNRLTDEMKEMVLPANIAGNMLNTYVKRALKRLEGRSAMFCYPGFQLVKSVPYRDPKESGVWRIKKEYYDVPIESKMHEELMTMEHSVKRYMGLDSEWIPPEKFESYQRRMGICLRKFGEGYTSMYRVNVLKTTKEIVDVEISDLGRKLNNLAVNKCLNSKQLDFLDAKNLRNKFVDEVIRIPPKINYGRFLLEEQDEEDEKYTADDILLFQQTGKLKSTYGKGENENEE